MELVVVVPSFYPATFYGGPIFSTYSFTKALAAQNIKTDVITTNANGKERLNIVTGKFIEDIPNLRIKYYKSLDSRGTSFDMFMNLKEDLKSADIVYLVAIFSPPTPFTLYLCKKLNKPLVISPRGSLGSWCLNQGSRFKKLWLKLFINSFADKIFWHVTSEEEEKIVKAVYPKAKTFILPNGINLEEFNFLPSKKNKSFFNKYTGYNCLDKKIIISMGRLHKIKGFDILIDSFFELQKKLNNCVLLIAGEDFGEKLNLEKIIAEKDLKSKVFLIGKLDGKEKTEFLHNADVFALASHHENFGMVYAEALAAGTPIIASKNTPWKEVEKFNCGNWVENKPDEFAEAIIEILNSDNVAMGVNGRKFIEDNFGWDKIAVDFNNYIEEIVRSYSK